MYVDAMEKLGNGVLNQKQICCWFMKSTHLLLSSPLLLFQYLTIHLLSLAVNVSQLHPSQLHLLITKAAMFMNAKLQTSCSTLCPVGWQAH